MTGGSGVVAAYSMMLPASCSGPAIRRSHAVRERASSAKSVIVRTP
jgi:hypothetical protein